MSILTAVGFLVIGGIVSAIVLAVGVMLAVGVVIALWASVSPSKKITGEILEIGKGRTARGTRVRVAYYTSDGRFESETFIQRPRLGAQIPLWYNPRKPDRVNASGVAGLWRQLVVMTPVVAVFAVLAAGMIISSVWYFAGSHTQLQEPVGGGSVFLTFTLLCGFGAVLQYKAMWKWHRMSQADGKILQYIDEPKPGSDEVRGILIAFQTAEGDEEEFWGQASVPGGPGDSVAVYYDPNKPAETATVETAKDHRHNAFIATTFTLVFAAAAVFMLVV